MIKYSFIIPTYNNAKLLKNSLEALNYLSVPEGIEYEAIVVDDGSECDTYSVISGINKKYELHYIYLERCENSSRARARNKGIEKAKGQIVVFIDADIIVNKDYIMELERAYRFDDDIIVVGTRKLLQNDVDIEDIRNKKIFEKEYLENAHAEQEFRKDVFQDLSYNAGNMNNPCLFCYTCNLAMPRNKINKVHGFAEELKKWGVEDVELSYRVAKENVKIVINSKNEVLHQFHGIRQGKFVKKEQVNEVDYNAEVFAKMHKGAFGLSEDGIKKLFRSIATRYKELEPDDSGRKDRMILEINSDTNQETFKGIIEKLLPLKDVEIIVIDYVENSDTDIWIQLLDCRKGHLKYYPASQTDVEKVLAS